MIADGCANPDCDPDGLQSIRDRWVQIEELQFGGRLRGEGPVQRRFSAVACSKRCAAAVLVAAAEADEAAAAREARRLEKLFPST